VITYFLIGLLVLMFSFFGSMRNDKYGLFTSFILIFLFLAFRYNYGNDYQAYFKLFRNINRAYDFFLSGSSRIEIGWILLNRIFNPLGFFAMVIGLALINCVVYYKFIKNYVDKKFYLFAVFIYYFNSYFLLIQLSAMRQCLAIFLFIYALHLIINRENVKSVIVILLACSFHSSALILIPLLILIMLLRNVRITLVHIFIIETIYISIFSLGKIYKPLLMNIAGSLFGSKYSFYITTDAHPGLFNILIYSSLLLILLIYYNKFDPDFKLLIRVFIVGLFLIPIGYVIPLSSRLALYFLPMSIVIYPKITEMFKFRLYKQIFIIAVITVISTRLITFFFFSGNELYYSKYTTILSYILKK
jgi:hypothetical protein